MRNHLVARGEQRIYSIAVIRILGPNILTHSTQQGLHANNEPKLITADLGYCSAEDDALLGFIEPGQP